MTSGFLDVLVEAYIAALFLGFATLHPAAFAIIGLLGSLMFIGAVLPYILSRDIASTLATVIGLLMYLSLLVWVATHMRELALMFFDQFTAWGAMVSGGAFTAEHFRHPSTVLEMGFRITDPIRQLLVNLGIINGIMQIGTTLLYFAAFVIIMVAFGWAVKDIIMAILSFHFAVMAGPVLIPWILLPVTSGFGEFGINSILGACLRMFLTTAVLGIGVPLFEQAKILLTPGGDATLYSAWGMAFASGIFAVLVHQVASGSSHVGGGINRLLPGSALTLPVSQAASLVTAGGRAVSGMIRGRQTA